MVADYFAEIDMGISYSGALSGVHVGGCCARRCKRVQGTRRPRDPAPKGKALFGGLGVGQAEIVGRNRYVPAK